MRAGALGRVGIEARHDVLFEIGVETVHQQRPLQGDERALDRGQNGSARMTVSGSHKAACSQSGGRYAISTASTRLTTMWPTMTMVK